MYVEMDGAGGKQYQQNDKLSCGRAGGYMDILCLA